MQGEAICSDNGFTADGELNCCANDGCCETDADCCGDLRCAAGYEVCPGSARGRRCRRRAVGQICTSNYDCFSWPGCFARLPGSTLHLYGDAGSRDGEPGHARHSGLGSRAGSCRDAVRSGSRGQFPQVSTKRCTRMRRPSSPAKPSWAGTRTNSRISASLPPEPSRFVSSRGRGASPADLPETAEVALRQQLSDGTVVRDEVRLVKDPFGNWSWFFGRDRAFVEEQIARYG